MRPLLEPLEPGERLSGEDQASRREAEFLADALAAQHLRAAGGDSIPRGVCTNCGDRCAPSTVYCDAECRADHEQRLAAIARQGRRVQ